jgi:uncharacterized protein with beta-barrel porin domain
MLSCHPAEGGSFRFTDEAECSWLRVTPRMTSVSATAANMGWKSRAMDFSLGHQFRVDDIVRIGFAGTYSTGSTRVGSLSSSNSDTVAGGAVLKVLQDPLEFALAVTGGQSVTHTVRFLTPTTTASSRQVDSFINSRVRATTQFFGEDGYYLRPFAEVNFNELRTGAFQESGAGPLDLVVPGATHFSATAGIGFELGGEVALPHETVFRPFLGYAFKDTMIGRSQTILASFEGAPSGVAPFAITNSPDIYLHEATAGFEIADNQGWNLKLLYTGSFGRTTRQDLYGLKLAIPF